MNSLDIIIALTAVAVSFGAGWIVHDYRMWSKQYDAWRAYQAQRKEQEIAADGKWNNVRWLA